jgi:hypothetical protein
MMFVFIPSLYLKVPIRVTVITSYCRYCLSFSTSWKIHLLMSHFVHTCSCSFIGVCSNWQVASGDSKTLPSAFMYLISWLLEFTDVLYVWICLWKMYALLASVSRTQLITSWVENRLLAYVKFSKSHSSNPPPLNILPLPNWLTV